MLFEFILDKYNKAIDTNEINDKTRKRQWTVRLGPVLPNKPRKRIC